MTGVGLNTAAGAIVHLVLLFVFLAWAGQGGGSGFKLPASSKLLVVIAVVLAIIGIVLATKKGRRLFRTHVIRWARQSVSSMATLARSPAKLAELFGGSVGVTVAYIGALYAAVLAFDHSISFAQVGAVYLGASIIAAAAPTPGGLGAMEAALVAGLTGVGVDSGIAVAAVLSYRLVTYWLPDPPRLAQLPLPRAPQPDLSLRRRSPLRFDRLLLASLGNASSCAAVRRPSRTHRVGPPPTPLSAGPGRSVTSTDRCSCARSWRSSVWRSPRRPGR